MAGDAATFVAMSCGPFGIEIDRGDARGDEVGLHGAGLVGVQELQERECGSKLGQSLLGLLAVAVGCQRQMKLGVVGGAILGNSADDGIQLGMRGWFAADQEPLLPGVLKPNGIGDQRCRSGRR